MHSRRNSGYQRSDRARLRGCLLLVVLLAICLAAKSASAQALPAGVVHGPSLAGITEYTYPNGLRVLLLPDSSSNTITVNVTYLVGSRHEGNGETGMAHLLEHLLFIETTNGRSIKKELEDRGARYNGTTWYDRTNYYETINASDENLRWALGFELDRMVNARIEKQLLDTEMTVVRNEFERGENSVASVLEERVMSTAYLWHNYGKSTIGSRADIERVPVDRLAAFYKTYYQPDNTVLTIAGRIDPPKTLGMIAETLGSIPRPQRTLQQTYTVEPPQDGERSVELRRVGKGQNLMMAYHGPAMAHPDSATLEVLSEVLTGGGTGRLNKALVDTRKALSVDFSVMQFHDPGLVTVSATLNDEQSIDEVKKVTLDILADLAREAPTQDEVTREITRITQRMDRDMADSQELALQLTEVIANGDWRMLFTNYEQLKRVSPDDVMRVANLYFKDSNRTVGVYIPESEPARTVVPETPSITELLTVYTPNITVDAGEALDPSPRSLETRIRRSTLPGGYRLALLPKGTRGNRVQASIVLRYGDENSLAGKASAAQMTSGLLMRGTRSKSRQQIQDEMQRLNATIGIGGGSGSVTASISTTAENLIPAIRLAVEILREPAFPETDFNQMLTQRIAQAERGRTEPSNLVALVLQSNLSPFPRSDVRRIRTIDEEIEDLTRLTLDDVKKFHEQFYGASAGELTVVGRFELDEVERAAAELLGSWKSASPYTRVVNNYRDVTRINSKIETPDKENAQFSVGLRLRMKDTDPDYVALVLANYMFGGGGLTARFPNRIRNREGLSYIASTNFSAPVEGDAAVFSASAIANPGNVPKVEASFLDELARTLRDGFSAAELSAARRALLDERTGSRTSDGDLLSLIAAREQYGRTLEWDAQVDARLEGLTLDEVNAAFRRHVNADAVSIVKGGDFKAANVYQ